MRAVVPPPERRSLHDSENAETITAAIDSTERRNECFTAGAAIQSPGVCSRGCKTKGSRHFGRAPMQDVDDEGRARCKAGREVSIAPRGAKRGVSEVTAAIFRRRLLRARNSSPLRSALLLGYDRVAYMGPLCPTAGARGLPYGSNSLRYTRAVRLALAVGVAIAAVSIPESAAAQQRHGDVSADGQVTALDAQAILSAVVGLPLPPQFVLSNGVAQCDGRTTPAALDAQIVLSFVIGLSTAQFCVGQTFGPGATLITLTPTDTSVLINRKLQVRAILRDDLGNLIVRPVTWETSNADLVAIDSARGDTAWVSNHGVAFDASATITAHADGTFQATQVRVFRSYAGIVIVPQRGDTLEQLNGITNFHTRMRDSSGVLGAFSNAFWSVGDPTIATVQANPSNTGTVTALTTGSTYLYAELETNRAVRDSVRITVALPPLNVCTGTGGVLHSSQTYTTPQVWSAATNPHYISGTLNFNTGATLTVQPGTLVCSSSGAFMFFHSGSKLTANGTVAEPISFKPTQPTDFWSGIQLGDNLGFGPTTDTSSIQNATFERVSNGSGAINARERHVVTLDGVRIRASNVHALTLLSPGSQMIRGVIDTVLNQSTFNVAALLGRGSIEETTIRVGGVATGVEFQEAATLRQVSIVGGSTAILQNSANDSARVNDVTIANTTGIALNLPGGLLHLASANVQITGGTGGGFRGQIGNLGILFPDSLKQEVLKGLGNDTIYVTGGTLVGVTLSTRPDVPWLFSTQTTIDTLAQLRVRPATALLFSSAGLVFHRGGTLDAQGEASKPIVFKAMGGGVNFFGLQFNSPGPAANPNDSPIAVSRIAFTQLDSASGQSTPGGGICGQSCVAAVTAADRHRLLIDNLVVRKAFSGAVYLNTPGSELVNSRIDTTGTASTGYVSNTAAVALGERILMRNTLVRRSGHIGVWTQASPASDTTARFQNVRIVASRDVGLDASSGIVAGDHGTVRLDSANAWSYRGSIQNLAALARDSVTQVNFRGNLDDVVILTGGTLEGVSGVHLPASPLVLEAAPGLRWHVGGALTIDTLAQLRARPAADFAFVHASLNFARGGTLNAVGEAGKLITFRPFLGGNFHGLQFANPGAAASPINNPTAVSTMSFVRLDSASGIGVPSGGVCHGSCSSAISAGDRHRLLIDNANIRKAWSGAIALNTPGSQIFDTMVDTTGNASSNYTSNTAALALGERVHVQNTLVRRSGNVGIYAVASPATDTSARLQNVRVVGSRSIGLQADQGVLAGDLGSVRLDSANVWPFQGTIQNFAALARDSVSQLLFLGNENDLAIITAGTLRGIPGTHTTAAPLVVEAIPGLRWQVHGSAIIDSLARLRARPAADFTFFNGNLSFQSGGNLEANGEAAKVITFRPVPGSGANFNGLQFQNVGTTPNPNDNLTALSTLSFVRLDSASGVGTPSGGICHVSCSAAINAGDRHRLMIDNARIHKAWSGAIYVNSPQSEIANTVVDTTGNVSSGYVTNTAAIALGERTLLRETLVHRSGNMGVHTTASPATDTSARLQNVRIVASLSAGLQADGGVLAGDLGSVRIDSANAYPFQGTIQNFATLARDAASQAFFLGNADNAVVITAGTLRGNPVLHSQTPLTVVAIPALRWQVHGSAIIDSLARLQPQPGSDFTFVNGNFVFTSGGTLQAVGDAQNIIRFRPLPGSGTNFGGLQFQNVGSTPNPNDNLTAVSVLAFVRLDSATGVGTPAGGICHVSCSAAINAGDRHRLLIDNARIHKAWSGAIYTNTPLTQITNSTIDTTGTVAAGYTTNTAALALGERVTLQSSLVYRSGHTGVYTVASPATDTSALLQNVRIVGSRSLGLQADQGVLAGDLGSVRIDSANVYPFQGTIQNFATLARDSVSQRNFLGNENDLAIIVAGALRGNPAQHTQEVPLTVEAIPGLRWQVHGTPIIDTLARLSPRPGSDFSFVNGSFSFQGGGVLNAIGLPGKVIQFRPVPGSSANFFGLVFHNPGAHVNPALSLTVSSMLQYVQLDSATGVSVPAGGICHITCSAAIQTGDRHRMLIDNARIHRAWSGAIYLAAPLSGVSNSLIDTTGNVASGYTTNTAAIVLNDTTSLQNVTVHRSGNVGIYVDGDNILMSGVRVSRSVGNGIDIGNNSAASGSNGLQLSGFVVDSAGGVGVSIAVSNLTLTGCDVLRSASHGFALTSNFAGVQIHDCNIGGDFTLNEQNLGQGVFNPASNTNFVDAVDSWWGLNVAGANHVPTSGGVNGFSGNVTTSPQRPGKRVP